MTNQRIVGEMIDRVATGDAVLCALAREYGYLAWPEAWAAIEERRDRGISWRLRKLSPSMPLDVAAIKAVAMRVKLIPLIVGGASADELRKAYLELEAQAVAAL